MEQISKTAARHVGFIGVGLMGHALAGHVQAAGHTLHLMFRNDADRQRCEDLCAAGARSYTVARDLAAACDMVVICVTGAPQVEDVVFAADGLLAGMNPGMVVVDCSTSLPATTQRAALALAEKGGVFLDTAMTGTPTDAEKGCINLLVGGPADALAGVRPVLETFAKNIYACGGTSAGHAVKLLHQFVVLSNSAVLAEAFSFAARSGVDMGVLCDVIASGGANSTAFQRMRPFVETGNAGLFRFSLANALKDMSYYTRMTSDGKAYCAVDDAVHNSYRMAHNLGLSDQFVPHLIGGIDILNGSAAAQTRKA